MLVDKDWLNDVLRKESSPPDRYQIIEAGWKHPETYYAGHIPGATYLDLSELEDPETYDKIPDEELRAVLLAHGLTSETRVVLYAKDSLSAYRAISILMYAGVRDVRVLDGGYATWLRSGYEVETGSNQPSPANDFKAVIPVHPEYFIDIQGVKALLADPQGVVVSVRSWAEFTGETSGYSYIRPKGRIAGAVWGSSGSGPYHMEDYFHADGTLRPTTEISAMWEQIGIIRGMKIAFYCATGWRASVPFFITQLLAWPHISIYGGGWHEWSKNAANPIEKGVPAK